MSAVLTGLYIILLILSLFFKIPPFSMPEFVGRLTEIPIVFIAWWLIMTGVTWSSRKFGIGFFLFLGLLAVIICLGIIVFALNSSSRQGSETQTYSQIVNTQPVITNTPWPTLAPTVTLSLQQELPGCVLASTISKNTLVPQPICIYGYVNGHYDVDYDEGPPLIQYITIGSQEPTAPFALRVYSSGNKYYSLKTGDCVVARGVVSYRKTYFYIYPDDLANCPYLNPIVAIPSDILNTILGGGTPPPAPTPDIPDAQDAGSQNNPPIPPDILQAIMGGSSFTPPPTIAPENSSTPFFVPTQSILLCSNAGTYSGSTVTCKIPSADCVYRPDVSGSPTFCDDRPYPNNNFQLVVWGNDWSDYDGKCIIVSGTVSIYNGKAQIVGYSRSQVSYCP